MDIAADSLNCPFCKRVLARPEEPPPPPPVHLQVEDDAPPSWKEMLGLPDNLSVKMLKPALIGILLTVVWVAYARLTIDTVPTFDLVPLHPDRHAAYPFEDHERYVIAYLAPWCRSCQWSVPTIDALHFQLKDTGTALVVLVGQAGEADVRELAETLDAPVYLDPDGVAAEALEVREYPHWMVANSKGEIIHRLSGTWRPVDAHMRMLKLD